MFRRRLGLLVFAVEPVTLAFLYWVISIVIVGSKSNLTDQFLGVFVALVTWRMFARPLETSIYALFGSGELLRNGSLTSMQVILASLIAEVITLSYQLPTLFVFLVLLGQKPGATWVFLPIICGIAAMYSAALIPVLSFATLRHRGVPQVITPLLAIAWYLSPGIYDIARIPSRWMWLYNLNPFVTLLNQAKYAALGGGQVDHRALLIQVLTVGLLATASWASLSRIQGKIASLL